MKRFKFCSLIVTFLVLIILDQYKVFCAPTCDNDPERTVISGKDYDIENCTNAVIDMGPEKDRSKLEYVKAQNNKIIHVSDAFFKSGTNLQVIDLRNNLIESISTSAFRDQNKLKFLFLKDNRMTRIQPGLFSPLVELETLWLQNNQIGVLEEGIFTRNTNLKEIFLTNNKIVAIGPNVFKNLDNILLIMLLGNPCTVNYYHENLLSENNTCFREYPKYIGIYNNQNSGGSRGPTRVGLQGPGGVRLPTGTRRSTKRNSSSNKRNSNSNRNGVNRNGSRPPSKNGIKPVSKPSGSKNGTKKPGTSKGGKRQSVDYEDAGGSSEDHAAAPPPTSGFGGGSQKYEYSAPQRYDDCERHGPHRQNYFKPPTHQSYTSGCRGCSNGHGHSHQSYRAPSNGCNGNSHCGGHGSHQSYRAPSYGHSNGCGNGRGGCSNGYGSHQSYRAPSHGCNGNGNGCSPPRSNYRAPSHYGNGCGGNGRGNGCAPYSQPRPSYGGNGCRPSGNGNSHCPPPSYGGQYNSHHHQAAQPQISDDPPSGPDENSENVATHQSQSSIDPPTAVENEANLHEPYNQKYQSGGSHEYYRENRQLHLDPAQIANLEEDQGGSQEGSNERGLIPIHSPARQEGPSPDDRPLSSLEDGNESEGSEEVTRNKVPETRIEEIENPFMQRYQSNLCENPNHNHGHGHNGHSNGNGGGCRNGFYERLTHTNLCGPSSHDDYQSRDPCGPRGCNTHDTHESQSRGCNGNGCNGNQRYQSPCNGNGCHENTHDRYQSAAKGCNGNGCNGHDDSHETYPPPSRGCNGNKCNGDTPYERYQAERGCSNGRCGSKTHERYQDSRSKGCANGRCGSQGPPELESYEDFRGPGRERGCANGRCGPPSSTHERYQDSRPPGGCANGRCGSSSSRDPFSSRESFSESYGGPHKASYSLSPSSLSGPSGPSPSHSHESYTSHSSSYSGLRPPPNAISVFERFEHPQRIPEPHYSYDPTLVHKYYKK